VISCRSGLRARVAYSILMRHGINTIVFSESNNDIIIGFDNFKGKGFNIVPYNK